MKIIPLYFIIFLSLSFSIFANTYKESAKVTYKKFSGSKKQEVIDEAYNKACMKGLKKHTNTFDDKTFQIYRQVKSQIEDNLFDYIVCDILEEKQDKKAKTFTIVVKYDFKD